jgi:uncharacterized protein (UPF0332 family)
MENARAEIDAARDATQACASLLSLGLRRDAMSRAYYAVFHAARALLLLEGVEAKTHAGVLRLVAERLVRGGKLDAKVNVWLVKLQAIRHESDYGFAFDVDPGDALQALDEARTFVERAAAMVTPGP